MATTEKKTKRAVSSAGAARTSPRANRQGGQPSPERVTLTPLESTKITGFGVQATYKMLRAGTLPHIKVGMRFFIPKNSLIRYLESCGEPTSGARVA